jgi:glutaredoxin
MSPTNPVHPVQVTVVHAPACHFCEDARAALDELGRVHALTVAFVEADSDRGRELIERHRAPMFPLVLVDGAFFSSGRLPRRKLVKLLGRRPAAVA